jgi:hypothetical protein
MTEHLTEEQIAAAVTGGVPDAAKNHLEDCRECGRAVADLRNALGLFRESATAWSKGQQPAIRVPAPAPWWQVWSQPRAQWALAGAMCVLMGLGAAIPAYRHFHGAAQPLIASDNPRPILSDAALLQQVNAQISRSVPGPMEPLMALMQASDTNQQ